MTIICKKPTTPFIIFSKGNEYVARWGWEAIPEMQGKGNMVEESVFSVGDYKKDIQAIIALRYSWQDESAIQRQRDTKPDDFSEYNDFCEAAKAVARGIVENE